MLKKKQDYKRACQRIIDNFPPGYKSVIVVIGDNCNSNNREIIPDKPIEKFKQKSIPYIEVSSETDYNIELLLDYMIDCVMALTTSENLLKSTEET